MSLGFLMLTGLPNNTTTPFLDMPTSSDLELSHGAPKGNLSSLFRVQKLNTLHLLMLQRTSCGFIKFSKNSLHNLSLLTVLYCDNQGAICLPKDATFHGHTKHINVNFHFICQTVSSGNIELLYILTEKMVTDIFTKSLARVKFEQFRANLNVM